MVVYSKGLPDPTNRTANHQRFRLKHQGFRVESARVGGCPHAAFTGSVATAATQLRHWNRSLTRRCADSERHDD